MVWRLWCPAAAMSVLDQCPAVLRIVPAVSYGVILSYHPGAGIGTRSRECRSPRQWMTSATSRAALSTSATMSAIRVRKSCWRTRMVVVGAFQADSA